MITMITQAGNVGVVVKAANREGPLGSRALLSTMNLSILGVEPKSSASYPKSRTPAFQLTGIENASFLRREIGQSRLAPQRSGLWGRLGRSQTVKLTTHSYGILGRSLPRVGIRVTSVGTAPGIFSGDVLQDGAMEAVNSTVGLADQTRHLATDAKLLHRTFKELELRPVQEVVGGVRTRQHVNPLKASLMAPPAPVDWNSVLSDSSLPLMVDIGCGSGRLLMVLAKRSQGAQNFLGLDVRDRLVNRANLWAEELNLHCSVRFLTVNATVAFPGLLATYPGPLELVSVLCPDPHFKRRYQKRRIVQRRLVDAILHRLRSPGGQIFMQSDVKDVALDMREQFDEHLGSVLELGGLEEKIDRDSEGWVIGNPLGVPSEREAHILANGGRVYRSFYRKL